MSSKSHRRLYAVQNAGAGGRRGVRGSGGFFQPGGLRMRLLSTAAAALIAAATLGADAARAQDCQSLWVERNSYYKNAGYCFRTQRAIQYFGNGGCYVYDERQLQ